MVSEMSIADGRMMKKESKDKSAYVQADVRTNFVDALIWKAHVVTDEKRKSKS